MLTKHINKL